MSKKIRIAIFALIWIPCFIIFLNLYPGTLSCDTPNQLRQAMLDAPFENANPFINTIILTFFVQIGTRISGANLGVALYTVFQFTLYCLVMSYCIEVLVRRKVSKFIIAFAFVFYAANPINLLYAVGMWKDSFFAIFFAATVAFVYDSIDKKMDAKRFAVMFLLALAASLSRNSGWSSLLVFAVVLLIYSARRKELGTVIARILGDYGPRIRSGRVRYKLAFIEEKNTGIIAACVGTASILSLVIAFVLLPMIGIGNGGSNVARSIPLQQIARTVTDNELTEDEKQQVSLWIKEGYSYEDISEQYRPEISDPMKSLFDGQKINDNKKEFNRLWRDLGRKYIKSYIDATVDHTRAYWWPGEKVWRFDNSIFDNPYGVVRESKLKPGVDIAATLYESYFSRIPFYKAWNSGAIVLWMILAGLIISLMRKRPLAAIMYVIPIMIFLGLIPVSPAALFRYMYSAFLTKPFLLAFLYIRR